MLRRFLRDISAVIGASLLALTVLAAAFAPIIAPYNPIVQSPTNRLRAPSAEHWLGTDDFGRDIFSRIIYGARTSIVVGVVATGIGLAIGASLGIISGFHGGRTDQLVMRAM